MSAETRQIDCRVDEASAGIHLDKLVARAAGVSRRIARIWIATGRVRVDTKVVRILTRPLRAGASVVIAPAALPEAPPPRPPAPAPARSPSPAPDSAHAAACGRAAVHAAVPAASHPSASGRPRGGVRQHADIQGARGEDKRPTHAPIEVLFCDRYLVAVNKPAGLLTEQDRFGSPALESVLPAQLVREGRAHGAARLWLVHRLDAGTSGVIVLARTPAAVKELSRQFHDGEVRKRYLAICRGRLLGAQVVDAPIGRAERTRHQVSADGRPAVTEVASVAVSDRATLVCAEPRTGRTHQIRVHLTHLGHPLYGDSLYGGPGYTEGTVPAPVPRPMLHAARLLIRHPKSGAALTLGAPPPQDFSDVLACLGLQLPAGRPLWQ